jgi:hypothetical protein
MVLVLLHIKYVSYIIVPEILFLVNFGEFYFTFR